MTKGGLMQKQTIADNFTELRRVTLINSITEYTRWRPTLQKRTAILDQQACQEVLQCLNDDRILASKTTTDFVNHLNEMYQCLYRTDDPKHPREIRVVLTLENRDDV